MEQKKTKKVDLERRKPTFFQIGLLLSLLIVFIAFEFIGTRDEKKFSFAREFVPEEIDVVLPTDPKNEVKPQTPQAPPSTIIEIIKGNHLELPDVVIDGEYKPNVNYGDGDGYFDITPPEEPPVNEPPLVDFPDEMPEFKGGEVARQRYLVESTVYPRVASELGIAGTVMVSFVVEPDGSISNVKVIRSVTASLDEEAIRVTKSMPKWNPGKQRGKAVRVRYMMPIKFVLGD